MSERVASRVGGREEGRKEEEEAGCCMPGAAAVLTWGIRRKKRGGRRHALTHTHTHPSVHPAHPFVDSRVGNSWAGSVDPLFLPPPLRERPPPQVFHAAGKKKKKKQLFPTSPPARSDKPSFVPRVIDSEGSEEDRESMSPPVSQNFTGSE